VVALPGEEAETFVFEREQLIHYWHEWLKRLKDFSQAAA